MTKIKELGVIFAVAFLPGAALGDSSGSGLGYSATSPFYSGAKITALRIDVLSNDEELNTRVKALVARTLTISPGMTWDALVAESALDDVRGLPEVQSAEFRMSSRLRGIVVVEVVPAEIDEPARDVNGNIALGDFSAFPVLYRSGDSYVTTMLNGGMGIYSDGNPWFGSPQTFTLGNPLVDDPSVGADTDNQISWAEGYLHAGIGALTPIAQSPWNAFMALSVIAPGATGTDIFSDETRGTTDLELAYAGAYMSQGDKHFKLSVGRQNFSLGQGFLISQFASQSNAGPRPGVYISPRTALDFSVIADAKIANWSAKVFFIDPNEYEPIESNTNLGGLNVAYQLSENIMVDVTGMQITASDSAYRFPDGTTGDRAGVSTLAAGVHRTASPGDYGIWFDAELATQHHTDFSMDAHAGYAHIGWIARSATWEPSLSYRYAHFSGDDPESKTYERFDTLYSGGLDHWLQGIQINKVLTQSNRLTHRIRLNVSPMKKMDLTLDLYSHKADEKNNLGANPAISSLASTDLGTEAQLIIRYYLTNKILVQGIVSEGRPGEAIKAAIPGDSRAWNTVQIQVFWGI